MIYQLRCTPVKLNVPLFDAHKVSWLMYDDKSFFFFHGPVLKYKFYSFLFYADFYFSSNIFHYPFIVFASNFCREETRILRR